MTRGPVVTTAADEQRGWAAVSRLVMTGSPVTNGYTARMASALVLRMMAASVVNANEWVGVRTVMPEVQLMSGNTGRGGADAVSMGSVRLLDGIQGRIR